MAESFTKEQLKEYKMVFEVYDENADGQLESNDVPKAMRACCCPLSQHEAEELVCDLDIYGDCQANFDAFLALLAQHQKPVPTTKELKDAFALLDADKSGSISAKELKHYLTSVGDKLSDEELEQMIKDIDKDGDGEIDYNEFADLMQL